MQSLPDKPRPRIAIIGARRGSQGIGEHVARLLASLGAEIPAIVGTSPPTLQSALDQLHHRYGLKARGYVHIDELISRERLDALAICSPDRFHQPHLDAALEAGLHVLCEKPLVFQPDRDPAADIQPLLQEFSRRRLVLMVNEQWPYTLSDFDRLHPAVRASGSVPGTLEIWLSPAAAGLEMIPRAMPHAISLMQAVRSDAETIEDLQLEYGTHPQDRAEMTVTLTYLGEAGRTRVTVHLRETLHQPRPFGYAIDGAAVRRVIETSNYLQHFEAQAPHAGDVPSMPTRIAIEDPLRLLLAEFLRRITHSIPLSNAESASILHRLKILREVYCFAESRLQLAAI